MSLKNPEKATRATEGWPKRRFLEHRFILRTTSFAPVGLGTEKHVAKYRQAETPARVENTYDWSLAFYKLAVHHTQEQNGWSGET